MFVRRISTIALGAVTAMTLGLGPAGAHYCYVNHMTPQAMAGAGASGGFVSFHDLASEFTGLCDAGIEVLAEAAGISVETPIHARVVMASGAEAKGKQAGGISHLDFVAIDAAFPDAAAACS